MRPVCLSPKSNLINVTEIDFLSGYLSKLKDTINSDYLPVAINATTGGPDITFFCSTRIDRILKMLSSIS